MPSSTSVNARFTATFLHFLAVVIAYDFANNNAISSYADISTFCNVEGDVRKEGGRGPVSHSTTRSAAHNYTFWFKGPVEYCCDSATNGSYEVIEVAPWSAACVFADEETNKVKIPAAQVRAALKESAPSPLRVCAL